MTKEEAIRQANKRASYWKQLGKTGYTHGLTSFHVVMFDGEYDVVADLYFETYKKKKSYYKVSCV